jgi:hypothetical protein
MNTTTSLIERFATLGAIACCLATLAGCSEEAKPAPFFAPVTSGGGTGGASAGSGGSRGGAGGARAGSGGVAAPAMPAPCGSTTCQLSTAVVANLTPRPPCCVDAATATCGWVDMAGACVSPPPVDPDCNKSDIGQNGCCVPGTDRCGIDASMFAAGCFELTGTMFANPEVNPPQACDGTLLEDADGGVPDGDGSGGAGGTGGSTAGGMDAGTAGSGGASAGTGGRSAAGSGGRAGN